MGLYLKQKSTLDGNRTHDFGISDRCSTIELLELPISYQLVYSLLYPLITTIDQIKSIIFSSVCFKVSCRRRLHLAAIYGL